jgi:hypothetical protein
LPSTSFYDDAITLRFYEQKLRYLRYIPYPNDGLVTFGASGTAMCDRQIVFKNAKVKTQKSDDLPFRGRQRRIGNAAVDYLQLDIVHMRKRLGKDAKFTMAERPTYYLDDGETLITEWNFEDAAQTRTVFEEPNPDTGEPIRFAITAKPDGILDYEDGSRVIFEYKTKASGIRAMNGKLDFKGAQDDHIRQITAESLVFGIREAIIVYESTQKPAWFNDEDNANVTKGQKTWKDGAPIPDIRAFYVYVTDAMQEALLADLARQAALVYSGETPDVTVAMTDKCGFCQFRAHCRATISDDNLARLQTAEESYAASRFAGKAEHRRLREYLTEGIG